MPLFRLKYSKRLSVDAFLTLLLFFPRFCGNLTLGEFLGPTGDEAFGHQKCQKTVEWDTAHALTLRFGHQKSPKESLGNNRIYLLA